jgi:hypothetical protein
MSKKRPVNWVLWGGLVAMVAAPAAMLYWKRTQLSYALDQGEATISAAALQAGQLPSSHNVTVTGGVIDRKHVVLWRLVTRKGSEKERFYLMPLRPKGAAVSDPVKVIVTAAMMLDTQGEVRGLLRNLGGQGPSEAIKQKLRQQGLKVADDALLIELGGSTRSELLWLLLWVGIAFFAPCMIAVPIWLFERRQKYEAGAEERLKALKASPAGAELEALEKRMFELAKPYFPADGKKSVMVRSHMLVGPMEAFVAVGGEEKPAPPEIAALFRELFQAYKKNKAPTKMITYNFLYTESRKDWRMTGGPR